MFCSPNASIIVDIIKKCFTRSFSLSMRLHVNRKRADLEAIQFSWLLLRRLRLGPGFPHTMFVLILH